MTKKVMQTIDEIKSVLIANGYKQDNFGHFKKTSKNGDVYRYKFQATSLRKESQVIYSDGHKGWVRLMGNYYSKLLVENNKIVGLRRDF